MSDDRPAHEIARPGRCPECGHATCDQLPLPKPRLLWRSVIPWTTLIAAIVVFAVWLARTAETNMIGSGTPTLRYASPAFTFADVKAVAAGMPRDDSTSFFDAVVRNHSPSRRNEPGERRLYAGYSTSGGLLQEQVTFGWPLSWYSNWRWSMYADAARRRDPIPIVSDPMQIGIGPNTSITADGKFALRPRWSWNMNMISYRPPPEETGGVSVWKDLHVLSIVATIGLAIAIGAIAHILAAIAHRLMARSPKGILARRIGWFSACTALLAMFGLALLHAEHSELARLPSSGPQRPPGIRTEVGLNTQSPVGISESELQAMRDASDRDQRLARAILAATNPGLRNDEALLLTELIAESQIAMPDSTATRFNRTIGLISVSDMKFYRRPSSSDEPMGTSAGFMQSAELTPMTFPAGWSVDLRFGSFSLTRSTGDPADFTRVYSISLLWLGTFLVGCALLWLLTRMPCLIQSWRTRRWRRNNQCVACGHALGPPRALA